MAFRTGKLAHLVMRVWGRGMSIMLIALGVAGCAPAPKLTTEAMPSPVPSRPQAAPIPASAWGPAVDTTKGYYVEEIRDGLYWVTEGIYQVMFLRTGEGVIVVDAPPSIGDKYLAAIAEVTDEPITHVIYSHSHADHIAAASMFPGDAVIIAHEETAAQLARSNAPELTESMYGVFVGGSRVPLPTVTFSESYTLKVGSQTVELRYQGPAHEPGNIFIYAPKQKVLMLVDVIFAGWTPFKNLAIAEDAPAYIQAHDQVLAYEFDTFIGGHVGRLGTREDVKIQREYMHDIKANAATALQTVDFYAVAGEVGFDNPWLLFDEYMDRVAQACADSTTAKWLGRLAAVDVFTIGHCWEMMMSLRVD